MTDREPQSLMEYIVAGIKANSGVLANETDQGMKIAGEHIKFQLQKAIEKIKELDGPEMAHGDSEDFVRYVSISEVLAILEGQNNKAE